MSPKTLRRINTRFVRQPPAPDKRVWYHADDADVLIDVDPSNDEVSGFEIYWEGKPGTQETVLWRRDKSLQTGEVDTGECMAGLAHKRTPIVRPDRAPRPEAVETARRLVERAKLPAPHLQSILSKL